MLAEEIRQVLILNGYEPLWILPTIQGGLLDCPAWPVLFLMHPLTFRYEI